MHSKTPTTPYNNPRNPRMSDREPEEEPKRRPKMPGRPRPFSSATKYETIARVMAALRVQMLRVEDDRRKMRDLNISEDDIVRWLEHDWDRDRTYFRRERCEAKTCVDGKKKRCGSPKFKWAPALTDDDGVTRNYTALTGENMPRLRCVLNHVRMHKAWLRR